MHEAINPYLLGMHIAEHNYNGERIKLTVECTIDRRYVEGSAFSACPKETSCLHAPPALHHVINNHVIGTSTSESHTCRCVRSSISLYAHAHHPPHQHMHTIHHINTCTPSTTSTHAHHPPHQHMHTIHHINALHKDCF